MNVGGFPSLQLHTPAQVLHRDGHLRLVVVVTVVGRGGGAGVVTVKP